MRLKVATTTRRWPGPCGPALTRCWAPRSEDPLGPSPAVRGPDVEAMLTAEGDPRVGVTGSSVHRAKQCLYRSRKC